MHNNYPIMCLSLFFLSLIIRAWAVSTGTLAYGWIVTLDTAIAVRGPNVPPTAALSSPERRTLPWTLWKCGRLENPHNQRRSEYLFSS